jgi:hypothetical protein
MVITLLMAALSRLVVRRTANIITGDQQAVAPMIAQGEA